jgi:ADP-ribosylglycohydrolase
MAELTNRILASFYGLAFGDALGHPLSTITYEELKCNYPDGFHSLDFELSKKYCVGDDTQMALYIGLAMRNAISDETYKTEFIRHLLFWFDDPISNRHASQHLLNALEKLKQGLHWTSATNASLNRCDVLARSSSVAYWMARNNDSSKYWPIAQLQAAVTHAHPVPVVASTLFVEAIVQLLNGMAPSKIINHLLNCLSPIEHSWDTQLMESLWNGPGFNSPQEFFRAGTEKCQNALEAVEQALKKNKKDLDPSETFGEGWTADEALAISLFCFLSHPQDPDLALKKAVFSNGPSDTLGSLTGSLAGAHNGSEAWPSDWYSHIEYKEEILELSRIIGRGALI